MNEVRGCGWWMLGILLLALGLRLPGYTESVWIDELYTSNLFCGDPIILAKTLYSDIHPPAYFLFMHVWNGWFGDSEVWLRLPPLICGLLSIVLVWRLGALLIGPGAGLVAAALLAVSPVHIWYSQEARPYSANILLLLLTLLAFYRLLQGPRRFWWAVLYFGALLGVVFTHYYMVAFAGLFMVVAMLRQTENRRRILVCTVLVGLLLGAYMAAKIYFSDVPTAKNYLSEFNLYEAWRLFFGWFLTGDSLAPRGMPMRFFAGSEVVVQILAGVAVARGVYRLVRLRQVELLLLTLLLPAFLLALNLVGLKQTYIERSALPALPLFLLVMAAGLTGWQRRPVQVAALSVASAVGLIVLLAFFTRQDHWTVYKPNPDWRSAAEWIGKDLGDTPQVMFSDYVSPTALSYYDPRMQEMKKFDTNDAKVRKLLDRSSKVFGTEGFPGKQLRGLIDERLQRYETLMAEMRAGTRLRVLDLKRHQPSAYPESTEFWLLVHGVPSPSATQMLQDASHRVVAKRQFRSLHVYRLRRVE